MSKGRQKNQERLHAIQSLGRYLTRRAASKCELCHASTSLEVIEIAPKPTEPQLDRALLVCAQCRNYVEKPSSTYEPSQLRFLAERIWSDIVPVQITAIRIARRISAYHSILEDLYISEEVQALLEE